MAGFPNPAIFFYLHKKIPNQSVLMKNTLLLSFFCLIFTPMFAQKSQPSNYYLLIGTYTAKTSEGIYVYKFNTQTGNLDSVGVAKGIKNPSFLAISPNQKFVYSVSETGAGAVNAFSFDKKTGKLTALNAQPSGGADPCYVAVDKTGHWALVGNYSGGNLSILPIEANGLLGKPTQTIQHEGKGPKPQQEKAHVHSVNIAPNNEDVFVADLGLDKIVSYHLEAKTGKLSAGNPESVSVSAGSGPRHFAFGLNPKFAYVIQELTGEITAFNYKKGSLEAFQTVKTLPEDFKENNSCADIHISPDGKFLYGSNRGHESLVIFSIDPQTGKLTYVGHQNVMGKTPRNFAIDPTGNFILVANQNTDNITVFKRNKTTGKLTFTGKEIKISMPVCLKFL